MEFPFKKLFARLPKSPNIGAQETLPTVIKLKETSRGSLKRKLEIDETDHPDLRPNSSVIDISLAKFCRIALLKELLSRGQVDTDALFNQLKMVPPYYPDAATFKNACDVVRSYNEGERK